MPGVDLLEIILRKLVTIFVLSISDEYIKLNLFLELSDQQDSEFK